MFFDPACFFSRTRALLGLAFAFAATIGAPGVEAFAAGTTGTIDGTVVDRKTGEALAGVVVAAVSPTGRSTGLTDAHGFYSFTGLSPDTFTISFERTGFAPESIAGVAVFADQVRDENVRLERSPRTIATITTRSVGGAFQPRQPQDTYTITAAQIDTIEGRSDSISEKRLLTGLPGATFDSSGLPVLRGGRESEAGYQFEGVDYVDAFTSQNVNGLYLNPSLGSLQLTPGAGDASNGNTGTGTINLISKRGTYPPFGSIQATIQGPDYNHEFALDYGFATPSGRFSNYFTYQGARQFGLDFGHGTPVQLTGQYYALSDHIGDDIVDNAVFKFGRNLDQSLQLFYQAENHVFRLNAGGYSNLTYKTGDPYWLASVSAFSGLSAPQIQKLVELLPYQPSAGAALGKPAEQYFQPNDTLKLQYSNNLDSSTYLTAKFYRASSTTTVDFPYVGQNVIFSSVYLQQGGNRTGGALDFTKALGAKHLVAIGGKFDFLAPAYDQVDPGDGLFAALFGGELYDFVPDSATACPFGKGGGCGYLYGYLNDPGVVPRNDEQASTLRQDFAAYVTDTYAPNGNVKIAGGVRLDGSDYRFASGLSQFYAPAALSATGFPLDAAGAPVTSDTAAYATRITRDETRPLVVEPRLSAAYQLGARDAVRGSYGRSVEFAPLNVVNTRSGAGQYARFASIPATQSTCGVTANLTCQNYADQLYWANQNFLEGIPYQPVKPATFNNYDFSYSHDAGNGIGFKVTPFYRRGYDATALVASPRLGSNGQPLLNADGSVVLGPSTATNLGVTRTSGIEILLTKEAPLGFSGSLAATYINETSNVIPNSRSEDNYPSIPPASLALGNEYRVGFLSPFQATLAVQYKSKGGIRIDPQIYYVRGYPIGEGLYTATYIDGIPRNVPNTNITDPNGAASAQQYVDPQSPGTLERPNVAATRGTANSAAAGGAIGHGTVFANMTLEFSKPGSRSTVGLQIFNLANNVYAAFGAGNSIAINKRYQPVATGISGPLSGYSTTAGLYPSLGDAYYYPGFDNGQSAYLVRPAYDTTQYQLYYNLKI